MINQTNCCSSRKDTKMKVNHNENTGMVETKKIVAHHVKILK